jgi:hypothetical protein
MKFLRNALVAAAAATGILAGTLAAQADDYNIHYVYAGSYKTIEMTLCGPVVNLYAEGENISDLDFYLYDAWGQLVFVDPDLTDILDVDVYTGTYQCESYTLVVENLGWYDSYMSLEIWDI